MAEEQEQVEQQDFPEGLDEGIRESLVRLRDITRMTGFIHDAQMLQLKHWPLIVFPCDQHAIQYESKQRVLVVTLRIMEKLPEEEDLKKRIKVFERWCWWLLGTEWSIRLKYRIGKGGKAKELHRGRRKTALPGAAKPAPEYGIEAVTEFRRYRKPNEKAAVAVLEDLPPILPRKE